MKSLPLFPRPPISPAGEVGGLSVSPNCTRCTLHRGNRTVCMAAEASSRQQHGILIVGEAPTKAEDQLRRPWSAEGGRYLRRLMAQLAPNTPVVWDFAVRCAPGDAQPSDREIEACRPFLTKTIRDARPRSIYAFGTAAYFSITGRAPHPRALRRGYSFHVQLEPDGQITAIPVFLFPDVADLTRNRFIRQNFEANLMWALDSDFDPPDVWRGEARIVETVEDAQRAAADIKRSGRLTFDCEWAGRQYTRAFKLLSVACTPKRANYAWVWDPYALQKPEVAAPLIALIEDETFPKWGHSIKDDAHAVWCGLHAELHNFGGDTLYLLHHLDPEAGGALEVAAEMIGLGGHKKEAAEARDAAMRKYRAWLQQRVDAKAGKAQQRGLFSAKTDSEEWPFPHLTPDLRDELDRLLLGQSVTDDDDSDDDDVDDDEGKGKKKEGTKGYEFALIPDEIRDRYNALDTIATDRLVDALEARLLDEPWELAATWDENIVPAIEAFFWVERWGIGADTQAMDAYAVYLRMKLNEVTARLAKYGWHPDSARSAFNMNAPASLAAFLYDELKIPDPNKGRKQTKKVKERSTNKAALKAIKDKHPIVADIQEYRRIDALLKKPLRRYVRDDGRIHTHVNVDGAKTGRLSTSGPSMQNRKRPDNTEGVMDRNCFNAAPGYELLEGDYKQLEIFIGGGLSGDPDLINILKSGVDYHMFVAKMLAPVVWKHPDGRPFGPEDVGKDQRQEIKPVNFQVFYDDEAYGMAFKLGIPVERAQQFIDAIYGRFKGLLAWQQACVREGLNTGEAWTRWNNRRARRRPLWDLGENPKHPGFKTHRRGTWNGPTQGGGNEFCVASVVQLVRWIRQNNIPARVILTVHDSILVEVRSDWTARVAKKMKEIMCSWSTPNDVPLGVDFKKGKAWGSLKEFDPDHPEEKKAA